VRNYSDVVFPRLRPFTPNKFPLSIPRAAKPHWRKSTGLPNYRYGGVDGSDRTDMSQVPFDFQDEQVQKRSKFGRRSRSGDDRGFWGKAGWLVVAAVIGAVVTHLNLAPHYFADVYDKFSGSVSVPGPNLSHWVPKQDRVTFDQQFDIDTKQGPVEAVGFVSEQINESLAGGDIVVLSWDPAARRWTKIFDVYEQSAEGSANADEPSRIIGFHSIFKPSHCLALRRVKRILLSRRTCRVPQDLRRRMLKSSTSQMAKSKRSTNMTASDRDQSVPLMLQVTRRFKSTRRTTPSMTPSAAPFGTRSSQSRPPTLISIRK
jgi:hypothetical protein